MEWLYVGGGLIFVFFVAALYLAGTYENKFEAELEAGIERTKLSQPYQKPTLVKTDENE